MKRQLATSALAVAALGLAAIGTAAPASATQTETFANCQAALAGQSISVPSGEDLRITFTSCLRNSGDSQLLLGASSPAGLSAVTISGATFERVLDVGLTTWGITGKGGGAGPLPGGSFVVYYAYVTLGVTGYSGSFTVNVAGSDPVPTPDPVSSSGPAWVLQQFGKPASGTCDANQPEGLNWANVPSGGWSESWAEWMNGRAGGSVCTRTLVDRGGNVGWGVL